MLVWRTVVCFWGDPSSTTEALIPITSIAQVRSDEVVPSRARKTKPLSALSSDYLENDLVAITIPNNESKDDDNPPMKSRLCAVRPDGTVAPLCTREDDVKTDLFVDPREFSNYDKLWGIVEDSQVQKIYGEGWYGQRPVPSLGGGPGYGAQADDVWSVTEEQIEEVLNDGVELPCLDIGISHGEKARGGSFWTNVFMIISRLFAY